MKKPKGVPQPEMKKTLIQKLRTPYSLFHPLMKKQKGFTLIELMVVMAIIAILATAGLSAYTGYIKKARDTARLSIASQVETAVNALMKNGIPPSDTELIAYLDTLNLTGAIDALQPKENIHLSALSDTLANLVGIPSLLAKDIKDPVGGKWVCLGYDGEVLINNQPCVFRYIVYEDGTYSLGYGVESESNVKKNFYKVSVGGSDSYFMQTKGTAPYIGGTSVGQPNGQPINSPYTSSTGSSGSATIKYSAALSSSVPPTTTVSDPATTGGCNGYMYNGWDQYGTYYSYVCIDDVNYFNYNPVAPMTTACYGYIDNGWDQYGNFYYSVCIDNVNYFNYYPVAPMTTACYGYIDNGWDQYGNFYYSVCIDNVNYFNYNPVPSMTT